MNTKALRFTSAMLAFMMLALCFCFGGNTASAEEKSEPVIVIAGSDFQAETPEISADNTRALLNAVKAEGYDKAYSFLFGGDLNNDYDAKNEELELLKNTVQDVFPTIEDDKMIYVQGNHDGSDTKGLTKSGPNDTDHYGLFVIPEDNYMWYNAHELIIKTTATVLETYLKQKAESGYDKPVFVISHIPLHYCHRTASGGDGKFACYLVDALNKYSDKLNIIFLFGHNHSSAYDDYIGGTNIYLAKGDTMYVSKKGKQTETPDAVTLGFTYLNAGYVGYANCLNSTLSLTVFEIEGNNVKINRISTNGPVDLKTKGAWSTTYSETASVYGADNSYLDIAYSSPQYLWDKVSDKDVTVYGEGLTDITVNTSYDSYAPEFHTAYASYDITLGGTLSGVAAVEIELNGDFNVNRPIFIRNKVTGETEMTYYKNGVIRFETDSVASYELTQNKRVTVEEGNMKVYEISDGFSDGRKYLIVSRSASGKAYLLSHGANGVEAIESEVLSGFGTTYVKTADESAVWKFEKSANFPDVYGAFKNTKTNAYLSATNGTELTVTNDLPSEHSSFRLSSGMYGIFTVKSGTETDTRYYLKSKNGFISTTSLESTFRVYAFREETKPVKITATVDSCVGSVESAKNADATTGTKLYLVGTDGSEQAVDVTLSMLRTADGKEATKLRKGAYKDLTVVYNGVEVLNGYALFIGSEAVHPAMWNEETFNNGTPVLVIIIIAGALFVLAGVAAVVIIKKKKANA